MRMRMLPKHLKLTSSEEPLCCATKSSTKATTTLTSLMEKAGARSRSLRYQIVPRVEKVVAVTVAGNGAEAMARPMASLNTTMTKSKRRCLVTSSSDHSRRIS